MACSTPGCGNEKLLARGLCGPCYHRLRKRGTVTRQYVINTGVCSVEGCGKPSFAKNLCSHHYMRAQHPLNHVWRMLRSRHPDQYPPGWDRFETFLKEVGERPSPKHQLRRLRGDLPWGISNVQWLPPVGTRSQSYTPEQQAAYSREWHLQRRFKISTADFNRVLAEQDGVCAGCRKDGAGRHRKTGNPVNMHVDHDHATGAVRGILCGRCNTAAGLLREDPASFHRLLAYLSNGGTIDGV